MSLNGTMQSKITFSKRINDEIKKYILIIDSYGNNWNSGTRLHNTFGLNTLKNIATIESIGSSTRIEGASLNNKEVKDLISSIKITKLETRDEQEIIGYHRVLRTILENYSKIEISENYINQLHGILLKYSNKDQFHRGNYKTLSNQVIANHPNGDKHIIFKTTDPHLVKVEMENLIFWVNERFKKEDLHPLLAIATFIYEFLSIHPYQDGNGRLARLLTTLLLLKKNYTFIQYFSFESIIESTKEEYYSSLMKGQKNRNSKKEKIDVWVIYFLKCLNNLTKNLEYSYENLKHMNLSYLKKYSDDDFYLNEPEVIYEKSKIKTNFEEVNSLKLEYLINDRQREILKYIKRIKAAQLNMIEKSLKIYSKNTLKKDLSYLVKIKKISRFGAGRGVFYCCLF